MTNLLFQDSEKLLTGPKKWRMENLYKIRDKNKNLVNLKFNNIQNRIYQNLVKYNQTKTAVREYNLKYRQGGVSTFWLIWWLDETLNNSNTVTGILSHEQESLKYLWEIVRIAYDNIPEDYKAPFQKYNESEISFPDLNSKIFVSLSIRSTAVHNLHISEICYIDPLDLKASLASVSPKGNISMESTAHGIGNDGYTMYQDAKAGLNGFNASFFPWWIQNEYKNPLNGMTLTRTLEETKLALKVLDDWNIILSDEQILWRRITKQNQGVLFDQEFPESDDTAFLSTGNPYFNNKKIMVLLDEAKSLEPVEETYEYTMWESPTKGHLYCAGADVAEGIDGDYSVMKILCVTCRREAFRYRARVGVDEFYKVLDKWGRAYFKALLAVERNNHGHAVILGLYEIMKYPNLYVQDKELRVVKERELQEQKMIVKIGWDTTAITKPIMLDNLKLAVEGSSMEDVDHFMPEFMVVDKIFLQEALTFVQESIKMNAIQGHHDDDIVATAIAFQMYMKLKGRLKTNGDFGIYLGDSLNSVGII